MARKKVAPKSLVVECPECESRVEGKELAAVVWQGSRGDQEPYRITLVTCSVCGLPILAGQELYQTQEGYEWEGAVRKWPSADRNISAGSPPIVSSSLEEAERCFKAKAFSACAVMCGRALEGLARHFETKGPALVGGLKELRDREIIDKRLYSWGETLRHHRNIAAHASGEETTKQDARDLLDFAVAISEYVFVLTEKFNAFMERKKR